MKKLATLLLAAIIGLGFGSDASIPTAAAAESVTTILPINLAKDGTVTASGEYGEHQSRLKAFDQFVFSKWLTFSTPAWLQYEFASAKVVNAYSITSAEDAPDRDPKSWVVKGSNDGITWTPLDTRTNQSFAKRHHTNTYSFANSTPYKYIKFDQFVNQYENYGLLQLAEIKLFGDESETYKTIKPTVTASGDNAPTDVKANLVDGNSMTKWLTYNNTAWLQFDFGEAVTIDGYALTSAKTTNNSPDADPKSWVLQGSNDQINWTVLDTKSDENFRLRHQRKHYLLDNNTTAYRYYKLNNIQNHSGWTIQLSEVEFSRTNDLWHAVNPAIEIQNLAGFAPFEQALPNAEQEILAITRKVNELLYLNPADAPIEVKKILVKIESGGPVASMGGDSELKTLTFNSDHLAGVAANPNQSLRDEIIGILYHEIGHAYQYGNFDVEALTDSLRYSAGYHDRYGVAQGGSWHNYGTANFIRWIDDTKHRGFIRKLNEASLDTYGLTEAQIFAWKESQFQLITGVPVGTLWSQYQQSLVP